MLGAAQLQRQVCEISLSIQVAGMAGAPGETRGSQFGGTTAVQLQH